jgi:hypothetical protein
MTKSIKIPKKIAGVKLPRKARKTANKAIKMGASPMVREIAVAAIGAAGGRAAGERKTPPTGEHGFSGRAQIHIDGSKVGEAFRAAAIDGLRRFLEGFEEGLRNIGEPVAPSADQPKPKSKPKSKPKPKPKPKAARASRPGAG